MKESVARKRNTVIRCHVEKGASFVTVKKRGFDICSNRIFHDFRANRLLHSILELCTYETNKVFQVTYSELAIDDPVAISIR